MAAGHAMRLDLIVPDEPGDAPAAYDVVGYDVSLEMLAEQMLTAHHLGSTIHILVMRYVERIARS